MKKLLREVSALPSTASSGAAKKAPPGYSRIKDAPSAFNVFNQMREDDRDSNAKRTLVQAMIDGATPYAQADLNETGQGDRSNLNFDEGGALLEYSMGGYVDLFTSTEHFIRVSVTPGVYAEDERIRHEDALTREFSIMLRQWPSFFSRFLYCCHHFVANGLAVGYHADPIDWRWEAVKFGDFFIPRQTKADPGALNVAGVVKNYSSSELYRCIANEAAATSMGWDVPAVKTLLLGKVKTGSSDPKRPIRDWESLQEIFKNNDLLIDSMPGCTNIRTGILWVKEHSGKWSQYIFEDTGTVKNFLFAKRERFSENRTPFTIFTYGIGTNGYYHSVRGLGYKIYPHIQVSNRLRNTVVDAAQLASSLLIQPSDETALNELALTYYGPYAILPPNNKVVTRDLPDLKNSAMPVIADMASLLQNKTGGYTSAGIFADSKERSRFEVEAYVAKSSKLSITSLNLFYEPFQNQLREVLRRVCTANYGAHLPGGDYVQEFRKRLNALGVPLDILKHIDFSRCNVVRAVGGGSAEARQMILNQLSQEAPALDDVGRRNLQRDRIAALVGYDLVERYVAPNAEGRSTLDDKMAILENAALASGTQIQALSNEPHVPHLRSHIQYLSSISDQIKGGQVDVASVVQPMFYVHAHAVEHVTMGGSDPAIASQIATFRQQLQQFGEFIHNGQEKLQKLQRQQAEAQQAGAESGPSGPMGLSPEMETQLAEHNLRLQMQQETHQLKMQLAVAEANQKRFLADAEARAKQTRLGVLPP